MADGTAAVNAGSGLNVDVFNRASTATVQYVKIAQASAAPSTPTTWTTSLSANTTFVAADDSRTGVLLVNNSNARVYIRYDTTAPTATLHSWRLDSMDRYEVPPEWASRAISVIADTAGVGNVLATLGTRA